MKTVRLSLREPAASDEAVWAPAITESLKELDNRFLFSLRREAWGLDRRGFSLTQAFAEICGYAYPNRPFHLFDRHSDHFLGAVGLHSLRCKGAAPFCAELWAWVRAGAKGKGYATEALGALVPWGFNELGCQELWIVHAPGCQDSEKIAGKLGFAPAPCGRNDYAEAQGLRGYFPGAPPNWPLWTLRR